MKLLVATLLLLLCASCLQAALVRREAEEPAPPPAEEVFTRYFQTFSDFMTKELPQKLKVEEMRTQAEAYLDRANKQLTPLAQELQNNVVGFFSSLLRVGKAGEQP
ncbi:apolipoprotein A-II [Colius striatus]|uniref:apolipoprotein A-II n=1 Tax=Colius striatus TaxID=57412 RepID=UPI002B1E1CE9|nr:apolipoprotein A-II [Colius striatus]